jgi:hypothetical protein
VLIRSRSRAKGFDNPAWVEMPVSKQSLKGLLADIAKREKRRRTA